MGVLQRNGNENTAHMMQCTLLAQFQRYSKEMRVVMEDTMMMMMMRVRVRDIVKDTVKD